MKALLESSRGAWVLITMAFAGVSVFAFAIGALMMPHSEALGDRLPELTCLQVAFTPERAASIVTSFSVEQQRAIASLLVPGDVVFAWSYGLLLAGLIGLLARRLDGAWARVGAIVMWLPIAASALDVIEDLFLREIVGLLIENPQAAVPENLPLFAGIAATLKYVALAVATPAYSIAGILRGLVVDRRAGALLIYFLLLVVCLSMVARPAQQIPACS
jgi:hypothetical protein